MTMPAIIHFYRVDDLYGFFSNFSAHPVWIGGLRWPTTEHYFQAQKFAGTPDAEAIRGAASPMQAAKMGRDRMRPLRPDWDTVKLEVMREALRAKFTQHPDLHAALLATGDALLVEHTGNDRFWGDGGDGKGKNWLGKLLMELREMLGSAR